VASEPYNVKFLDRSASSDVLVTAPGKSGGLACTASMRRYNNNQYTLQKKQAL
jgi:hypothetical protein